MTSGSTGVGRFRPFATTTPGQPEEWYLNCLLSPACAAHRLDREQHLLRRRLRECSASCLPSMEPVDSTPTGGRPATVRALAL